MGSPWFPQLPHWFMPPSLRGWVWWRGNDRAHKALMLWSETGKKVSSLAELGEVLRNKTKTSPALILWKENQSLKNPGVIFLTSKTFVCVLTGDELDTSIFAVSVLLLARYRSKRLFCGCSSCAFPTANRAHGQGTSRQFSRPPFKW